MTLALARVELPDLGDYRLANRDLLRCETGAKRGLSRELWDRLIALTLEDLEFRQVFGSYAIEVQREWAEVLLDQMFGLLMLYGRQGGFSPSRLVDIVWHVFMLDSWSYMNFCDVNFGCYIHHRPCLGKTTLEKKRESLERTVQALLANDISVIPAAWTQAKLNLQCDDDTCEGDTKATV